MVYQQYSLEEPLLSTPRHCERIIANPCPCPLPLLPVSLGLELVLHVSLGRINYRVCGHHICISHVSYINNFVPITKNKLHILKYKSIIKDKNPNIFYFYHKNSFWRERPFQDLPRNTLHHMGNHPLPMMFLLTTSSICLGTICCYAHHPPSS